MTYIYHTVEKSYGVTLTQFCQIPKAYKPDETWVSGKMEQRSFFSDRECMKSSGFGIARDETIWVVWTQKEKFKSKSQEKNSQELEIQIYES